MVRRKKDWVESFLDNNEELSQLMGFVAWMLVLCALVAVVDSGPLILEAMRDAAIRYFNSVGR